MAVPELINGGFENPALAPATMEVIADASQTGASRRVEGWLTTAPDHLIELWASGFNGVASPDGGQFAELNARSVSTLYQDLSTDPGTTMHWSLLHRGRDGVDTMALNIGPEGKTVRQGSPLADDNNDWGKHEGVYTVPDGQTMTRFEFESISAAGGNRSVGNFLDAIVFREPDALIKLRSLPTASAPDHWEVHWWDGKDAHGWLYSRIFVLTALRGKGTGPVVIGAAAVQLD